MRRIVVVLVAVLLSGTLAASARAAGTVAGIANPEGQFALGVSGGLVEPFGQIGNEPGWVGTRGDGLDLRYGWNGEAHVDFFMTSFLSAGLWYGQGDMKMRDARAASATGHGTYEDLLEGSTWVYGGRLKGWLATTRSWTPYAFVGVAHVYRRVDLSHALVELAPNIGVFSVKDDGVAFDAGVGMDQPLGHGVSLDAHVTYLYSGALKHSLPWMGRDLVVHDWKYGAVNVGLTWHPTLRPPAEIHN